jgi:hypothetical protein
MEWALGAAAAPALALVDEPLELLLLPQPAATMTSTGARATTTNLRMGDLLERAIL